MGEPSRLTVPETLLSAMRAAGMDPNAVLAQAAENPIPSDDVEVAEQQGDWRSLLPDETPEVQEELFDQEAWK